MINIKHSFQTRAWMPEVFFPYLGAKLLNRVLCPIPFSPALLKTIRRNLFWLRSIERFWTREKNNPDPPHPGFPISASILSRFPRISTLSWTSISWNILFSQPRAGEKRRQDGWRNATNIVGPGPSSSGTAFQNHNGILFWTSLIMSLSFSTFSFMK